MAASHLPLANPAMRLALPVLGVVLLQRLWELWLSWRRLRAACETGQARPIAERTFFAMAAVHGAWLTGCLGEALWRQAPWRPELGWPAAAAWALALALRLWMMSALGSLWNVRLIERREQPIVTGGPYRYVRHPNYLAVIVEVAAVPLLVGAYATAIVGSLANALVLWPRIRREEAYLSGVPAWRAAFARKKRFLPGLF
jgi:methyltransferase